MITAISSVKQNGNVNNVSLKKANQVAFAGNPVNLLKNELKISRFADEATGSISNFFKKILGKAELPFSKKPLTANADLTHILPDGTPINIPMPEVSTAVTKILDGANVLKPDAADLAAGAVDVLTTNAALASVLPGAHQVVETAANAADALASKADIIDAAHTSIGLMATKAADALSAKTGAIDAVTTGADALATKTDVVDTVHKIINGVTEFVDKLL